LRSAGIDRAPPGGTQSVPSAVTHRDVAAGGSLFPYCSEKALRTRHPARFLATAAVTAVAVLALVPALRAGANPPPEPGRGGSGDAAVEYLVSTGMVRAEATRRIAAQPAQAEAAARLLAQLGPQRSAGAFVETDTGELVVNIVDPADAALVRAAGARPRTVPYSTAALDAVAAELAESTRAGGPDAEIVEAWAVDAVTDTVVVEVAATAAEAEADRLRARGPMVTVRPGSGPSLATQQNVHPGFTKVTATLDCTAGTPARDGFGNTYLIISAHCVATNSRLIVNGQEFGHAMFVDLTHDVAAVRRSGPAFELGPFVWAYAFGWKTLTGAAPSVQNHVVCQSGMTTGHACGLVLKTGLTKTAMIGGVKRQVFGLTETNICTKLGDSGGPVLLPSTDPARVYSTGVTESSKLYDQFGQNGNQLCGNEVPFPFGPQPQRSYFTPIFTAINGFALTVLTA
jgi:streptogrisin C